MILVEELLQPITEGNPSGAYLRSDPVYGAIKEARREEESLNQGAWQRELKTADFPQVIALSTNALQKRTKDLQIAAWLTEALLRQEGFAGLAAGLNLLYGLLARFWESVYPPIEEDDYGEPDLEWRVSPLDWVGLALAAEVRSTPLNQAGHSWHYFIQATPPEAFNRSFHETPMAFYLELEQQLDASLTNLAALTGLCDEKFGYDSPSFGRLQSALETVGQATQDLLAKKRTELP